MQLLLSLLLILLLWPQPGHFYGHFENDPEMQYKQGDANKWGQADNFNWHVLSQRNEVYFKLTGLNHLVRPVRGHPRQDNNYDHTVKYYYTIMQIRKNLGTRYLRN